MNEQERFRVAFSAATGGKEPYPWQERFAIDFPRLVDAPTGSGKTEAAILGWLWRRRLAADAQLRTATPRRLIIALPMRVLVEQTASRAQRLVDRLADAGYLHAGEIPVHQLLGGAADSDWVLAPAADGVVVATIDMALSRALNRGYGRSRAAWPIDFGLINEDTLWILDEIQLLDAALPNTVQLDVFRDEQRRGAPGAAPRTVWMSATLRRDWLRTIDHPLPGPDAVLGVGDDDRRAGLGDRLAAPKTLRRTELDPADARSVAQLALSAHSEAVRASGMPLLTIVLHNTVRRAVNTFDALRDAKVDADLLLLHSRFRPPDRQQLLDRLQERPGDAGRIVVTTQVIEAGVDLDASALISELCPWASLVQRAGRLNRQGSRPASCLYWLDPPRTGLDEGLSRPYRSEQLEAARALLRTLEGHQVGPDALRALSDGQAAPLLDPPPRGLVLRRPDLRDLFDTDPTLDGDDDDIRAYIRLGDDLDVQVAWRPTAPTQDDPLPGRDELCPVPLTDGKSLLDRAPWRWNYADRCWDRLGGGARLLPGDLLVLLSSEGGYDTGRGWDAAARDDVSPVTPPAGLDARPDSDGSDHASRAKRWITLPEHTDAVVAAVDDDVARLPLSEQEVDALRLAARFHDAGKAHPVFQVRLGADPQDAAGPWAKSGPGPYEAVDEQLKARARGRFRHEVASVLLLEAAESPSPVRDLALYLVGAHHGKLRVTPRLARAGEPDASVAAVLGVRSGDEIPAELAPISLGGGVTAPALEVRLGLFELGSLERTVWIELVQELVDRYGVFRLAYLEALLRVADQRATMAAEGTG